MYKITVLYIYLFAGYNAVQSADWIPEAPEAPLAGDDSDVAPDTVLADDVTDEAPDTVDGALPRPTTLDGVVSSAPTA